MKKTGKLLLLAALAGVLGACVTPGPAHMIPITVYDSNGGKYEAVIRDYKPIPFWAMRRGGRKLSLVADFKDGKIPDVQDAAVSSIEQACNRHTKNVSGNASTFQDCGKSLVDKFSGSVTSGMYVLKTPQ